MSNTVDKATMGNTLEAPTMSNTQGELDLKGQFGRTDNVQQGIKNTIHGVIHVKTENSFENILDAKVEATLDHLYLALKAWRGDENQAGIPKSNSGLSAYSDKLKEEVRKDYPPTHPRIRLSQQAAKRGHFVQSARSKGFRPLSYVLQDNGATDSRCSNFLRPVEIGNTVT
ncbi:unnamed protein product [Sympodiomycopsis kandeliae]